MDPRWRIELLGGLRARRGDEIVSHFRTRKAAELLAYLACYRQRSHPREVLAELFWPEDDASAGRHSLSMALSFLRHQLEPPGLPDGAVLVADRHCIGLNAAAVTSDVAEFEAALNSAARAAADEQRVAFFSAAADLYGGDFLPGYYSDWIFPEQQRLDELYFQALRQLIALLEGAGDPEGALQYALRSVAANRLREESHQEVIRLYAAAGQREAALRQYRELERLLKQELDAVPSADTQALVREILAGEGRLKIEYCRLSIADCSGLSDPTAVGESWPAARSAPERSAIPNLQYSIFNLPSPPRPLAPSPSTALEPCSTGG